MSGRPSSVVVPRCCQQWPLASRQSLSSGRTGSCCVTVSPHISPHLSDMDEWLAPTFNRHAQKIWKKNKCKRMVRKIGKKTDKSL